eukprot:s2564_g29.t1
MLACGMVLLILFVLGFVALCSYATWMMPSWSVSGRPERVQCFRFCTSKYRLDAYWFVVPVFLRHLGIALAVAVGTNMPPAQTGLASIILVIYLITQTAVRPWKVPLMNIVDIAVTAIFVLLLSKSIQVDRQMEMDFAELSAFVFLLLMLFGLVLAGVCAALAMVLHHAGRNVSFILDLGKQEESEEIAKALRECAEHLLQINFSDLSEKIDHMNSYDVKTILDLISLLSLELEVLGSSSNIGLNMRVALSSLNYRLTQARSTNKSSTVAVPSGPSADENAENADAEAAVPPDRPELSEPPALADLEDLEDRVL